MKKEEFSKIISQLEGLISIEERCCKDIKGKKDFELLPYKEINKRISLCRQINSIMDKFFKDELYHLIGMGHMDAVQMSKLMSLTRKIGSYRTAVKAIAGLTPVNELPSFTIEPELSSYKCETLGLTLKNTQGGCKK